MGIDCFSYFTFWISGKSDDAIPYSGSSLSIFRKIRRRGQVSRPDSSLCWQSAISSFGMENLLLIHWILAAVIPPA